MDAEKYCAIMHKKNLNLIFGVCMDKIIYEVKV